MITTLALLHAPSSLPELQRLIDYASVLRDPKFKDRVREQYRCPDGSYEVGMHNAKRFSPRYRAKPASGG